MPAAVCITSVQPLQADAAYFGIILSECFQFIDYSFVGLFAMFIPIRIMGILSYQ